MVSFTVGGEEYALDILQIQEIYKMSGVARHPDVPEYVDGVITLKGQTVPVVNLRRRFGLPRKQWDHNARIVVVGWAEKQVGFVVERLQDIVHVPVHELEHFVPFPGEIRADYLSAVAKRDGHLLSLLDIERIFHQEKALLGKIG